MSNKSTLTEQLNKEDGDEMQMGHLAAIRQAVTEERTEALFLLKDHPGLETLYNRRKDECEADAAKLRTLEFDIAKREKDFWDVFAKEAAAENVSVGKDLPGYLYTSVKNGVVYAAVEAGGE